jgi:hypothetical protein
MGAVSNDRFDRPVLSAFAVERCMNAEFLLHLKRAVREIRREQASSSGPASAGDDCLQSVPYGTELH